MLFVDIKSIISLSLLSMMIPTCSDKSGFPLLFESDDSEKRESLSSLLSLFCTDFDERLLISSSRHHKPKNSVEKSDDSDIDSDIDSENDLVSDVDCDSDSN